MHLPESTTIGDKTSAAASSPSDSNFEILESHLTLSTSQNRTPSLTLKTALGIGGLGAYGSQNSQAAYRYQRLGDWNQTDLEMTI